MLLLDGYNRGTGLDLSFLFEPTMALNDKITGYLDITGGVNTKAVRKQLAINAVPNIDIAINEHTLINAGISFGLGGDAKQDDIGIVVTLVALY